MKKESNRYNIIVVSDDKSTPKGFKQISPNTYIKQFVGTNDYNRDIDFMRRYFGKMFRVVTDIKIELLN